MRWWADSAESFLFVSVVYLFSFLCFLQSASQSASVGSSAWPSSSPSWSSKPAQHACPAPPLSTLFFFFFVSVNKIHFHRFVCPVFLYTCSKKLIIKKFAAVTLYHRILQTLRTWDITQSWWGQKLRCWLQFWRSGTCTNIWQPHWSDNLNLFCSKLVFIQTSNYLTQDLELS